MMTRQRGLALTELLVVIATIGILATMLFPVFARAQKRPARPSASPTSRTSIAMAV